MKDLRLGRFPIDKPEAYIPRPSAWQPNSAHGQHAGKNRPDTTGVKSVMTGLPLSPQLAGLIRRGELL